jgi:translation initiation factor 2 alpha subunit (eIF-2alpha)
MVQGKPEWPEAGDLVMATIETVTMTKIGGQGNFIGEK